MFENLFVFAVRSDEQSRISARAPVLRRRPMQARALARPRCRCWASTQQSSPRRTQGLAPRRGARISGLRTPKTFMPSHRRNGEMDVLPGDIRGAPNEGVTLLISTFATDRVRRSAGSGCCRVPVVRNGGQKSFCASAHTLGALGPLQIKPTSCANLRRRCPGKNFFVRPLSAGRGPLRAPSGITASYPCPVGWASPALRAVLCGRRGARPRENFAQAEDHGA